MSRNQLGTKMQLSQDNKGLSEQAKAWCCSAPPWGLRSSFPLCGQFCSIHSCTTRSGDLFDPRNELNIPPVLRPETATIYLIHSTIYLIQTLFVDDASVVDGHDDPELFDCVICMETVPGILKFSSGSCGHTFCSGCVVQYVAAKLGENVARVKCPDPGCEDGAVEPSSCFGINSLDLLDKWGFLLCESVLGANRVNCSYRECSAPLLADGESRAAAIAEAECPHCHTCAANPPSPTCPSQQPTCAHPATSAPASGPR